MVALRKESVDRNDFFSQPFTHCIVALRKESVDRNFYYLCSVQPSAVSLSARRAWIEIPLIVGYSRCARLSLSARRAWIEIPLIVGYSRCARVALRKESVDRNFGSRVPVKNQSQSLSARRAWIEIPIVSPTTNCSK